MHALRAHSAIRNGSCQTPGQPLLVAQFAQGIRMGLCGAKRGARRSQFVCTHRLGFLFSPALASTTSLSCTMFKPNAVPFPQTSLKHKPLPPPSVALLLFSAVTGNPHMGGLSEHLQLLEAPSPLGHILVVPPLMLVSHLHHLLFSARPYRPNKAGHATVKR